MDAPRRSRYLHMRLLPCCAASTSSELPNWSMMSMPMSSSRASSISEIELVLAARMAFSMASWRGSFSDALSLRYCLATNSSTVVVSLALPNSSRSSVGRLRDSSSSLRMLRSMVPSTRSMSALASGMKMLSTSTLNTSGMYLQASTGDSGFRNTGLLGLLETSLPSAPMVVVLVHLSKNFSGMSGRGSLRHAITVLLSSCAWPTRGRSGLSAKFMYGTCTSTPLAPATVEPPVLSVISTPIVFSSLRASSCISLFSLWLCGRRKAPTSRASPSMLPTWSSSSDHRSSSESNCVSSILCTSGSAVSKRGAYMVPSFCLVSWLNVTLGCIWPKLPPPVPVPAVKTEGRLLAATIWSVGSPNLLASAYTMSSLSSKSSARLLAPPLCDDMLSCFSSPGPSCDPSCVAWSSSSSSSVYFLGPLVIIALAPNLDVSSRTEAREEARFSTPPLVPMRSWPSPCPERMSPVERTPGVVMSSGGTSFS
mmetsp:Transcript_15763/g.26324  ORF Transcript_15763/g.26324 Transcript_15763/m.26324 type:complete len:481 (-) Transcript_15763:2333-3775(-)